MGWAVGDNDKVSHCKVYLSAARADIYRLKQSVQRIEHSEKRKALLNAVQLAWDRLDDVELHLNR